MLDQSRLARITPWLASWISSGRLAGASVLIHHDGQTAYQHCEGLADRERNLPMAPDTVVRIYSMTKPLTSVALMMLYEEGRFQLDDPISRVLPCFETMHVWAGEGREPVPAERQITYRDLLTHTSGLTYGFMEATPVDALYRAQGVDFQNSPLSLAALVEHAATLPLLAQPGTAWNYSIATDVLGHLIALHSGQPFDRFLTERVLAPLGMTDTGFHVTAAQRPRFAATYARGPDGAARLIDDPATSIFLTRRLASGGGGLVGTVGGLPPLLPLPARRGPTGRHPPARPQDRLANDEQPPRR